MNLEYLNEAQILDLIGGNTLSVITNPNLSDSAREYIRGNISPVMEGCNPDYEDYQYEPTNILDYMLTDEELAKKMVSRRDMMVLKHIEKTYSYIEFYSGHVDDEEVPMTVEQKEKNTYFMPETLKDEVFYRIKQHERKNFYSKSLAFGGDSGNYAAQLLCEALEIEAMVLGVEFSTSKLTPLRTHDDSSFIVYNETGKTTTIQFTKLAGAELDDLTLGYLITSNAFRALAKSSNELISKHNHVFTEKYKNLREAYTGLLSDIISGDDYEVSNEEREQLLQMEKLVNIYAPLQKN